MHGDRTVFIRVSFQALYDFRYLLRYSRKEIPLANDSQIIRRTCVHFGSIQTELLAVSLRTDELTAVLVVVYNEPMLDHLGTVEPVSSDFGQRFQVSPVYDGQQKFLSVSHIAIL